MKYFNRIILFMIIVISGLVGIFDFFITTQVSYTLYFLTFVLMAVYIVNEIKNKKNMKVNIYFLFICLSMIVTTIFREEKAILYAMGFIAMIFSYYSINAIEFNEKILNKISLFISFLSLITMILNGIFNSNLESGVAFSGRLNPFMYMPYVLIARLLNKDKKILRYALDILLVITIADIIWSESRASQMAIIFIIIIYIVLKLNNKENICDISNKRLIRIVCLCVIVFQVAMPNVYIFLYNNFKEELNEISYEYTEKSFFSGRQGVWEKLFKTLSKQTMFGTGDVLYTKQDQTAHNEFMNMYYCWGIFVAIFTTMYIYSIIKIAIKKSKNKLDIIILLSYVAVLLCTTFETYLYTIHFYIFNTIYMAYLIGKEEEDNEERRVSKYYNTDL